MFLCCWNEAPLRINFSVLKAHILRFSFLNCCRIKRITAIDGAVFDVLLFWYLRAVAARQHKNFMAVFFGDCSVPERNTFSWNNAQSKSLLARLICVLIIKPCFRQFWDDFSSQKKTQFFCISLRLGLPYNRYRLSHWNQLTSITLDK